MNDVDDRWNKMIESGHKIIQILGEMILQQKEVANLSNHTPETSRHFNFIYNNDDGYEKSTIPLNEIDSQITPTIVITSSPPILPIEDLEDSLIMRNEELSTIPKKESDELIKSSVEDFVPIPSKSEDISESDSECDLPSCDDVDKIELLRDPSTPKMSVASILEGFTNEPPLEENDLDENFFSPTYVRLPFEYRHYLSLTYVIRIFLLYLTYSIDSSLPLSSESEDTVFDPGISAFHFLAPMASHQSGTFMGFNVYSNILNESPMEIFSSTHPFQP
nr:hypothetical protein [Tanacetum cinerariifolium]